MGNDILSGFPNAEVIGNEEKPSYNGCFDIYIRGVGALDRRDSSGKLYLYKKIAHGGKMPTGQQILDKIMILVL